MSLPSHSPPKAPYRVPLRYVKAWAAFMLALAVLIGALTGLLITLGY